MSEQYHGNNHEHKEVHNNSHEAHSEALRQKHEHEQTKSETEHNSEENLDAIRRQIEKQSHQTHEAHYTKTEHSNNHHPVIVNKQLKDMSFSRTMVRTRKRLSAPSRAFSKVIHAPVIDKSSEFVGKTVARPSGMLAGAFLAFIGTSILLWVTRYYGYSYNYLLVILLFAGGMVLGLAGEGVFRIVRKK
jgi:hypothetical protein